MTTVHLDITKLHKALAATSQTRQYLIYYKKEISEELKGIDLGQTSIWGDTRDNAAFIRACNFVLNNDSSQYIKLINKLEQLEINIMNTIRIYQETQNECIYRANNI